MLIDTNYIEKKFKVKLSEEIILYIKKLNLKYKYLSSSEKEKYILDLLNYISDKNIIPSGPKRKNVWESGWEQNYDEFRNKINLNSLIPYYFRKKDQILRLDEKLIKVFDPLFEYKFMTIIHKVMAQYFLADVKNIYEFGAGSCHNTLGLAMNLKNKNFYVTDWVRPTIKICSLIEKNKERLNVGTNTFKSYLFNYFDPDNNFNLAENSAIFTFASLEQLGDNYQKILKFFLNSNCKFIINMEPFTELHNTNNLVGSIGHAYSVKRNYLNGYYNSLKKLEKDEKIKIVRKIKLLGSKYHDSRNFIVWKKV